MNLLEKYQFSGPVTVFQEKHLPERVKPLASDVHEGWTYQGVCGLCGELVDTGEPYENTLESG